ncbi:MAG: methyltransferase domain-containing protein [Actinobacteria bacterium]|jgi:ubiquinone/menaquinone biosynthesis C-methylase UbiE|nr:methyltransferase domain-containing protein [Actinomycetota bacterium]
MTTAANTAIDYPTITTTQRQTWSQGDFHEIARLNVVMAEAMCDAGELRAGERVLDVGCGSGTAALVAARRYCQVTGIDYVPSLLDRARQRAAADGVDVEFLEADAQQLPFEDDRFDAVVSVYGVQFAPDQPRAASELVRVTRPGGRIVLAGPMPHGWSGDFFAVHARHNPPPPGIDSPLRWGTADGLADLFGDAVADLVSEPRSALQYWHSTDHAVDVFWRWFGPTISAAERLDDDGRRALRADLQQVFERYDRAADGTAVVENTYLLSVLTLEP